MKNLPFTGARAVGGGNDCRHVTTMWKRKHAKKHNVSERNGCKCIQFDAFRASELFPSKPIRKLASMLILCAPKQSQHSIDSFINYIAQYLSSSIWNECNSLFLPPHFDVFSTFSWIDQSQSTSFFSLKQTQKKIHFYLFENFWNRNQDNFHIRRAKSIDKLKNSTHITNHLSTTSGTTNFILTEQSTSPPPPPAQQQTSSLMIHQLNINYYQNGKVKTNISGVAGSLVQCHVKITAFECGMQNKLHLVKQSCKL